MPTEKSKKELVILGVGLAMLIGLLVMRGRAPKEKAVDLFPPPASISLPGEAAPPEAPIAGPVAAVKEVRYIGRQNRDPVDNSALFPKEVPKPVAEEAPAPQAVDFPVDKFKVTAVLWGSKRPQAIINDNVIGLGDDLDGGRITGIDKEGIHISYEGKEVLLQLK